MIRWLMICALVATPLLAGTAEDDYQALLADYKAKRHLDALEKVEIFVKDHPDYKYTGSAYYIGGHCGMEAGEYERAETLYRAMIADHPTNKHIPKARNELVIVLDHARKLDACIAQCEINLEAEPDSKYVDHWHYMLGRAHFRLWRFEQAETALTGFQEDFPDSSYFNWAQFYLDRINPDIEVNDDRVVAGYSGKFAEDIRFLSAVRSLPEITKNAWDTLKKTLGVSVKDANVIYEFRDKNWSRSNERAQAETICLNGKPCTRIVFYTEHIVVSAEDFRSRLVHELKHAAFRDVMGVSYLDLPKWVREGLAVYGAQQIEDRLPAIIGGAVFSGNDPRSRLDGIDDPDHDINDYLEDCAAFMWLESRKKGTVKQYCKRLLDGEDCLALFAELGGMKLREALDAAAAYALKLVDDKLGEAEESYLAIRDNEFSQRKASTHLTWFSQTGVEDYAKWLEENPDHPFTPNCRYRLGKALILVDRHEEGRSLMQKILDQDQSRSSVCDDAQYWICQSFEREGKTEEATDAYRVLLRDYSWSRQANQLKDKYTPAGPVKGND